MERLEEMTATELYENLYCPLEADDRDIYLRFQSKGDCVKFYTLSHAPLRENSQENVLHYIGIFRVAPEPPKKIKFNRGGDRGSYRGNWDRNGRKGNRKN